MAERRGLRVALAWLLAGLVTIEVLVILAFVPSSVVANYNQVERHQVAAELGPQTEGQVLGAANTIFGWTLIKPGFYPSLNAYILKNARRDYVRDNNGTQYAQDRVATLWKVLYAMYYRLALIGIWLPYLLPLAMAGIIDAVQARKVRRYRFSYVSPMVRAYAGRLRFYITCLLILAVLLPVHVPSMFYPVLLGGLLVAGWISITHLQKEI